MGMQYTVDLYSTWDGLGRFRPPKRWYEKGGHFGPVHITITVQIPTRNQHSQNTPQILRIPRLLRMLVGITSMLGWFVIGFTTVLVKLKDFAWPCQWVFNSCLLLLHAFPSLCEMIYCIILHPRFRVCFRLVASTSSGRACRKVAWQRGKSPLSNGSRQTIYL